ncbi:hypothetical protein KGM_212731 [Danaus plexippus plexippus]|uniref:Uncharacterized protein n=1 Tax=Danaus plexippus plexippus TaxID=278856 RepID=A0A212FM42_DANPL|nr:hypothetical protein KGM_212731 [Danaus plexippus plexippus]
MFLSYEIFAAFGVSALVSFLVSASLLLTIASKSGLLTPRRKGLQESKGNDTLIPSTSEKPTPSAPELALLTQ